MKKLYTADLSPYSARVRMQIYAKGITDIVFELPEHWGMPKFRERFPIGRVPVLDIDDDLIPESEVIAEYLEEIYPEPSLLGGTPRETAHIRTLARIGDVYILNNTFMLARLTGALGRQAPAAARDDAVSDQLAGEVVQNLKALDKFIGTDGFACSGRVTLADCALVPGLFFVETVLPAAAVDSPIPALANVAAYWAAIQKNEHAARVLIELRRGLEERREMIRSGAIERFRAARAAAQKAADAQTSQAGQRANGARARLNSSDTIGEHLRALEELLLQPGTRRDAGQVADLLSDDFVEIGSSGSAYTKAEIIAALQQEKPVRWTLTHFKTRTMAEGVVLATYRATRHGERVVTSLRSSIWRLEGGRWRMAFHQGTVAKE